MTSAVPHQREIVDRRAIAEQLGGADREKVTAILKAALAAGRAEIARRLEDRPYAGSEAAQAYAFLADQILRLVFDYVTLHLHRRGNATTSERLLMLGVGGYGRGEMALHSDIDIAFVTPWKPTPWTESVIEAILYLLWDLGLTIGHSTRSVDEVLRATLADQTIRTAVLEARYVWGDEALYDEVSGRFWKEVVAGAVAGFVKEKLDEREARHKRMGDSRYVVEPNVKEGKGGLRDLHTLFWIGKYRLSAARRGGPGRGRPALGRGAAPVPPRRALPLGGALPPALVAGRAEERLTFDYQREIAGADELCRPGRRLGGRALHAPLFPAREDGRRPHRGVPRPSRRAVRAARAADRLSGDPPPARASSTASCSTAAGSPFRTTISSPRIRSGWSRCSRLPTCAGWRSTRWRCAPRAAIRQADRRRGARRPARQRGSSWTS
jgi:[protein-PII] uridylyltransferase